VAAAFLHAPLEFFKVAIEMVYRLALDTLAFLSRHLPIEKPRSALANRSVVMVNSATQYLAMHQIRRLRRCVA
jgi:hypothetical protein